jgi:hypothetical protein
MDGARDPLSIFSSHSNRVSATAVSGCQETGFWRWRQAAETGVDFQLKSVTETHRRDEIRPRGGYFAESREISANVRLRGGAGRTRTRNQMIMSLCSCVTDIGKTSTLASGLDHSMIRSGSK